MCLAVPGKLLSIDNTDPIYKKGKVDFNGAVKDINLSYVPEAKVGDYVNVHVGFAISIIDENAAEEQMSYLQKISDLMDEEDKNEV
jgi:hydrogenase expression/formation protein HypC